MPPQPSPQVPSARQSPRRKAQSAMSDPPPPRRSPRKTKSNVPESSISSTLPPPSPSSTQRQKKRKASPVRPQEEKTTALSGENSKAGKRKRGDGKPGHILIAEHLLRQVNRTTVTYGIILIHRFPVRHGHTLSKLTELSLSSILVIMNSYVCAIEAVRHSMCQTPSIHLSVQTLDMGNFTLGSTLRAFKMR